MNNIDFTTVHNDYDLLRKLGVTGVTGGFPYSSGKLFVRVPRTSGYRDPEHFTWEEATGGVPHLYLSGARGAFSCWVPAEVGEQLRGVKVSDGAKLKVSDPGQTPCLATVHPADAWSSARTCAKPATEDGRCGRHAKLHAKRVARDEAWQAQRDADRAERERREQADRAAREMIEFNEDLLEDLGLKLTTNGDGNCTLPVETIIGLVQRLP